MVMRGREGLVPKNAEAEIKSETKIESVCKEERQS